MLLTALNKGVLNTPIKRYIHKLADETERLNTRHILQQRETENLRNVSRGVLASMAYWHYVPLHINLYVKVLTLAKIKS